MAGLSDCVHCKSAGSVRAGRCQICDWEANPAPVARATAVASSPADDRRRDEGTLTATSG